MFVKRPVLLLHLELSSIGARTTLRGAANIAELTQILRVAIQLELRLVRFLQEVLRLLNQFLVLFLLPTHSSLNDWFCRLLLLAPGAFFFPSQRLGALLGSCRRERRQHSGRRRAKMLRHSLTLLSAQLVVESVDEVNGLLFFLGQPQICFLVRPDADTESFLDTDGCGCSRLVRSL